MNYRTVSKGQARSFSITVGLREGFQNDAPTHSIEELSEAVKSWIEEKVSKGASFLSGRLDRQEIIYGMNQGFVTGESVGLFSGEVDPVRGVSLSDDIIVGLLNELADRLGERTKQKQVYVRFKDSVWVREGFE